MSSFIAALWTCDTSHDPLHCQKTIAQKHHDLHRALVACQQRVTARINQLSPTNEFQAIFAAPEYFFTAVGNHRLPLSETAKVYLEANLLGLSKVFKKILIVPGSVYYIKPLTKAVGSFKLDRQTGRPVRTTAPKDRRAKTVDLLTKAGLRDLNRMGANDTEMGGFMVYQDGAVGTGAISGLKVPSIMEKQDAIAFQNTVILRNSTYLFLNGMRYGKYDKQSDFHESLQSPDQMVFVPGTKDECPEVGGHRFGVEICMDHALGRLKKRNPTGLDFHIVVSDHVKNQQASMAMGEFGYFLHASSATSETQVMYRDDAGALADLTHHNQYHFESKPLGSGKLDFWLLPLPQALKAEEKDRKVTEQAQKAAAMTQQSGMQRSRRVGGP